MIQPRAFTAAAAASLLAWGALLAGCDNGEGQVSVDNAKTQPSKEASASTDVTEKPGVDPAGPVSGDELRAAREGTTLSRPTKEEIQEKKEELAQDDRELNKRVTDAGLPPIDGNEPRFTITGDLEQHAGKVYTKDTIEFAFEFKNTGQTDLEVRRISTSCGCTAVRGIAGNVYPPGTGDVMRVRYTPRGPGDARKFVQVFTNDPVQSVTRLTIGAEMVPIATVEPRLQQLGDLRAGKEHTFTFYVTSGDPNLEIKRVSSGSQNLAFEVGDPEPVENDPAAAIRYPVTVTLASTIPAARFQAGVDIEVVGKPEGFAEAIEGVTTTRLIGNFRGDLILNPRFGRVTAKQVSTPFELSTIVSTDSGRDFEITRAWVDNATFDTSDLEFVSERLAGATKVGPDGSTVPDQPKWRITVRGVTPKDPGVFRGMLMIESNLEDEGPAQMIFSGFTRADGDEPQGVPQRRSIPLRPSSNE